VLNFLKLRTLMLMVIVSSALIFVSCGDDDDDSNGADKTALNALIAEADELAMEADDADYPQTAIDAYKTSLASIKSASGGNRTQAEINNLETQLKQVMDTFKSKAYGFIDETTTLVAGWHFDEGTGTTATAYSTTKHVATFKTGSATVFATNAMAPTWVDGVKGGKAVYLNNGAHLEVPYTSAFLPTNLSISVWIKPLELYENNYIVSQNYWNGYKLQTQGGGKPFFTYKKVDGGIIDADNETDNSIKADQWNHIVVTLNSTTKELMFYVNGTHTKTWTESDKTIGPITQTLTAPDPQPFLIGVVATEAEMGTWSWTETPTSLGYFKGAIDELKLYNVALAEGQVSKMYTDEKP
ncbi:MAG TPA: LamG domain-containing protein, partial [Prolixibacteraceae bacterium]|nr:LamG domain-containing protein [Prolixibacteraceae bacterium]